MRQRWLLAVTTSAVVLGAAGLSAQGGSSPSPRPFAELFRESVQAPRAIVPLVPREGPSIELSPRKVSKPSPAVRPVDCHLIVIPVDPRIDPHMSITPPDSRRFAIRESSPVCR
jgi:hypothetical protein